jgi:hypothetical protein
MSVSQNDTGNWCQCAPRKALDDQEASPAASLIRFVKAGIRNISEGQTPEDWARQQGR